MSEIFNFFKGELFSKNPARMKISYFKWQFAQNSNFNLNHFEAKSDKKKEQVIQFLARATVGTSLYVSLRQSVSQCV